MADCWKVLLLNEAVEKEYWALPKPSRAKISWIITIIEKYGLEEIREPYVKHLREKLWEIRGKSGRAIYITVSDKKVVILRCFIKDSKETPQTEIELAMQRSKEIEENEDDSI